MHRSEMEVSKLVRSDGRALTVMDVGPVLMTVSSIKGGPPIKHNGWKILEDDEARELVRELLRSGCYQSSKG